MTLEEERRRYRRTGEFTSEQYAFLLAVEFAEADADVFGEFMERCPDSNHDEFSSLWTWARAHGYCGNVKAKSYHLLLKGQKALKRRSPDVSDD